MKVLSMVKQNERIIYEGRPSFGLLGYWLISRLLFLFGALFVSLYLILIVLQKVGIISSIKYYIYGFIVFLFLGILYYIQLLKSHVYVITSKEIKAQAGVLSRRKRSIGISKITDITVHQNILERLFRISNIGIQTAGMSGRPEITFIGLSDVDFVENIINKLIKK